LENMFFALSLAKLALLVRSSDSMPIRAVTG
jgi:hypothetical protein